MKTILNLPLVEKSYFYGNNRNKTIKINRYRAGKVVVHQLSTAYFRYNTLSCFGGRATTQIQVNKKTG